MDYKYIQQILERYWKCETTLEEEDILKTFFSQDNIPEELRPFQPLFSYAHAQKQENALGDDFDERILALTEDARPVKARVITMRRRLMPLFKAAAVVAIILTLGNAMQMAVSDENAAPAPSSASMEKPHDGPSVAKIDSAKLDTMKQSITPDGFMK